MLVLTRKIGESIRIGDKICLTVVEVDGRNIKLGIDAPRNITIHREEVFSRIQDENRKAVAGDNPDLESMADLFKRK